MLNFLEQSILPKSNPLGLKKKALIKIYFCGVNNNTIKEKGTFIGLWLRRLFSLDVEFTV